MPSKLGTFVISIQCHSQSISFDRSLPEQRPVVEDQVRGRGVRQPPQADRQLRFPIRARHSLKATVLLKSYLELLEAGIAFRYILCFFFNPIRNSL